MLCTDIHSALSALLAAYPSDQIVVVKDENVVFESPYPAFSFAVSEPVKSLETVSQVWDFLFAHGITRKGIVVAVGGGVLTDLTGFACATYKRGIGYVNIPTTLLAMIDASSGGKTGINYHGLKNSIGVFAPPVQTLICPKWLATLPSEQFLSGFGEILKTGLIADAGLWHQVLQYDLDTMDIDALTPIINTCVRVKEQIVAADPHEENVRKVLNLGHTFGHALEEMSFVHRTSSLRPLPHGYVVVYGLIAELYLSVVQLGCPQEPLQQLTQIMLHHYGRPHCKCSDRAQLIALMQQDKKNECTGQINCTLIRDIGDPVINQVISVDEANEAWDYLFSL